MAAIHGTVFMLTLPFPALGLQAQIPQMAASRRQNWDHCLMGWEAISLLRGASHQEQRVIYAVWMTGCTRAQAARLASSS
jgi:hypothetical protein